MIALQITNIKDFMSKLLLSPTFDHFLLQEATIVNGASYVIDGHFNKKLYNSEEAESFDIGDLDFFPYEKLRGNCLQLVKGKHTPGYFKFVFLLSPQNLENTLKALQSSYSTSDISGMFLNIKFQVGSLIITTGISYTSFNLDKTLDHEWDRLTKIFLTKNSIEFEEI